METLFQQITFADYQRATLLRVQAGTWLQLDGRTLLVPCLDPKDIAELLALDGGTIRAVVWAVA